MDHKSLFETETDFRLSYDREVPCVVMVWRGYHSSASFRLQNEAVLAALTEHRAGKLLCDIRNFLLIGATDQSWLNQDWLPRAMSGGLQACAIVAPIYYFNRVAVQTVLDRLGTRSLNVEHFDTPKAARAWLKDVSIDGAASRGL